VVEHNGHYVIFVKFFFTFFNVLYSILNGFLHLCFEINAAMDKIRFAFVLKLII